LRASDITQGTTSTLWSVIDGHENFWRGEQREGRLYLTGHIGAWEMSSYAHVCRGFRCNTGRGPMDNRRPRVGQTDTGVSGNKRSSRRVGTDTVAGYEGSRTVGVLEDKTHAGRGGYSWDSFGHLAAQPRGNCAGGAANRMQLWCRRAYWDGRFAGRTGCGFELLWNLVRTGNPTRMCEKNATVTR